MKISYVNWGAGASPPSRTTGRSMYIYLLPSALARGFECEIYSQMVRMYVRTYVSVTL